MVIVLGDAPMHDPDKKACLELVEKAHSKPEALTGRKVPTGSKKKKFLVRPWVFNCIQSGRAPPTTTNFREITEAGGGKLVSLQDASEVTTEILMLTFGEEWEDELNIFIDIYFSAVGKR